MHNGIILLCNLILGLKKGNFINETSGALKVDRKLRGNKRCSQGGFSTQDFDHSGMVQYTMFVKECNYKTSRCLNR